MTLPLFEKHGDLYQPTELARGPWDPGAQHGGAPGALLLQSLAGLEQASGKLTRATVEFLRPVPMRELRLELKLVRGGRQVQRSEATLFDGDIAVARAEGLHVAAAPGATSRVADEHRTRPEEPSYPGPDEVEAPDRTPVLTASGERRYPVSFAVDAVEIRPIYGNFKYQGPGAAWICLHAPVIDDEPISPWARLAAACDFGNGISSVVPWKTHTFANADLTIAIGREPLGEWIGIAAVTRVGGDGVAVAESSVFDTERTVGVSHQVVLIRPRG